MPAWRRREHRDRGCALQGCSCVGRQHAGRASLTAIAGCRAAAAVTCVPPPPDLPCLRHLGLSLRRHCRPLLLRRPVILRSAQLLAPEPGGPALRRKAGLRECRSRRPHRACSCAQHLSGSFRSGSGVPRGRYGFLTSAARPQCSRIYCRLLSISACTSGGTSCEGTRMPWDGKRFRGYRAVLQRRRALA